jgi:hypothetical protein
MKNGSRFPALFFLAFAVFVCQQALVIGVGTLSQPGPGLLAFGAGVGIGLLALWFLVQSFASKKQNEESVPAGAALSKGRFLLVCLSLFGYTVAAKWLGFLLSTFLFAVFIFYMIESKKWWRTLIKAALVTIGNHVFFVEWLGLSLPKGFFGW